MSEPHNNTPNRRNQIRNAARALFDAHGYANTTIDAVATEAGIAKGSVYNYFSSKQALFLDVVHHMFGAEHAILDDLVASDASPTEKIAGLFDIWQAAMTRDTDVGGLVLEFYSVAAREDDSGLTKAFMDEHCAKHRQIIEDIVRDGMAAGDFHEENVPEEASVLIMAVLDGLMLRTILEEDVNAVISPDIVDALKDAVITALRITSRPFNLPLSPNASAAQPTADDIQQE